MSGERFERPSLKRICMRQLVRGDASAICFTGVPPHLIKQVINEVRTPAELKKIAANPRNRDIFGMDEAIEEKWHRFFIQKFWVGRQKPPELPEGATWCDMYESAERNLEEENRIMMYQRQSEAPKAKKNKVLDPSEVPQSFSSSRNYVAAQNRIKARPGSLLHDFLKRFYR